MNGGGWLGVTDGHGVTVSSEQTNPPMTGEGEGGGGVVVVEGSRSRGETRLLTTKV